MKREWNRSPVCLREDPHPRGIVRVIRLIYQGLMRIVRLVSRVVRLVRQNVRLIRPRVRLA
jgi:hypothetical protein